MGSRPCLWTANLCGGIPFNSSSVKSDFDVRWLKGSASATIFAPWRQRLESRSVVVRDGHRATAVRLHPSGTAVASVAVVRTSPDAGAPFELECDAVVSAVSISALQGLLRSGQSPGLAQLPEFMRCLKVHRGGGARQSSRPNWAFFYLSSLLVSASSLARSLPQTCLCPFC